MTQEEFDKAPKNDAIDLLSKLREVYIFNVGANGDIKTPLLEVIELWEKVNRVLEDGK